jgi:hypothetical protein
MASSIKSGRSGSSPWINIDPDSLSGPEELPSPQSGKSVGSLSVGSLADENIILLPEQLSEFCFKIFPTFIFLSVGFKSDDLQNLFREKLSEKKIKVENKKDNPSRVFVTCELQDEKGIALITILEQVFTEKIRPFLVREIDRS